MFKSNNFTTLAVLAEVCVYIECRSSLYVLLALFVVGLL